MSQLMTLPQISVPAAQLPVTIDYPAALALRQMAIVQDELPKYLLAPEVSALLHYVPDLHRKMLLATLWNTGAALPVCATGHPQTARGKSGKNGRENTCRQSGTSSGAAVR